MLDGREAFNRAARHALRRRIRGDEVRMLRLETLELVEQRVEFFVGNLGRVVDVVALLVMADGITQIAQTFFGLHGHNRLRLFCAADASVAS